MSLNDALPVSTAGRLSALEKDDYAAIVHAASLGLSPEDIVRGVAAINRGEIYDLPTGLGSPRPITINAWSFVNDPGQYRDTYHLSDAEAGALRGRLRTSPDEVIEEITTIVSRRLQSRGSNRPVTVSRAGMPTKAGGGGGGANAGAPKGELKQVILQNPTLFGFYTFTAEDTGRTGSMRFSVSLGGGLYSFGKSKVEAVDAARICRAHGRYHDVLAGRIFFCRTGKPPVTGNDIPEKVTFDGRLAPGDPAPPEPVVRDQTVAG